MRWLFKNKILMDENNGNNGGTGGAPAPTATPGAPAPQAGGSDGDQYDDFGYKIEAPATPPPAPTPNTPPAPAAQPAAAATPPVDPNAPPVPAAGGYGNEPPPPAPVVPPVVPPVPPDPNAPPPLEVVTTGLDKAEADQLVALATTHKLTKDQAQALINARVEENKQIALDVAKSQKESQDKRNAERAKWFNELKTDKTFGEQNFDQTRHKVNKVLNEVMTRTNKMLTNTSTMLLPDVMRDLADLHDKLYGTEAFDGGAKPPGGSGETNTPYGFLDDFYK